MNFYDYIDKIIYINLDARTDRKIEIEETFKKYEIPESKIIRLSAVKHKCGNIGCYKSHTNALDIAIKNKYNNVLILEDDFDFRYEKKKLDEIFFDFFKMFEKKWCVFQLSWGKSSNVLKLGDTNFFKCIKGGNTGGYFVNNTFYEKMMKNYKDGLEKLIETDGKTYGDNKISYYNIDMYWTILQKETFFWITYLPSVGIAKDSKSDIR